jgi:hypothetical protein
MELAHHKGVVTGRIYAASLLRPAHTMARPKCPYPIWRPFRRFAWRLGMSAGVFEVLYRPGK